MTTLCQGILDLVLDQRGHATKRGKKHENHARKKQVPKYHKNHVHRNSETFALTWGSRQTFGLNISQDPRLGSCQWHFQKLRGAGYSLFAWRPDYFQVTNPSTNQSTTISPSTKDLTAQPSRVAQGNECTATCRGCVCPCGKLRKLHVLRKSKRPPKDFPASVSLPLPYPIPLHDKTKSEIIFSEKKSAKQKRWSLWKDQSVDPLICHLHLRLSRLPRTVFIWDESPSIYRR